MSAIERVMKAYVSKYDLDPKQAARVRAELSAFIGELGSGTGQPRSCERREPTMLPETRNAAASRDPLRGTITASSPNMPERVMEPAASNVSVVTSRT
jgi:hypothetical protein